MMHPGTNIGLGVLILFSLLTCQGESARETPTTLPSQPQVRWKLICLGDDVVIGSGLEPTQAFPAQLEKLLQANSTAKITVVNAGIKGETSAGADERIEWILQQRFDAILLALGGNEKPNAQVYRAREEMVRKINRAHPSVSVLALHTATTSNQTFLPPDVARTLGVQLLTLPMLSDNPVKGQEELARVLSEQLRRLLPG